MGARKPKFKIGDIVIMNDEFHFNPSHKAVSIGRIESIHIKFDEFFGVPPGIVYSVSGFSLMPKEEDLELFEGFKTRTKEGV